MVQKTESKPRGRPRAYDVKDVVQQAMGAFWQKGFAATSVDDLCAATGLNKPSLYAGFGDKQQLYAQTLDAYVAQVGRAMAATLTDPALTAREAIKTVLTHAIDLYLTPFPERMGEHMGRGCFMVVTAPAQAMHDEVVRTKVAAALTRQDALFAERIKRAQAEGEVDASRSAQALATLVSATLHTMAIRARAGLSHQALMDLASGVLNEISPPLR